MTLSRFGSLLAILGALCSAPAFSQGPDRLVSRIPIRTDTGRSEVHSPEWFSAAAARTDDGKDNLKALPDEVLRGVDRWLSDVARGLAKKDGCIGEAIRIYTDPPTRSGHWPNSLAEFVSLGRTVVVGRVRERDQGFARGLPGTAFWVEVEEALRTTQGVGAEPFERGFSFILPVAEFEFAGYRFCRRDDLIKALPEVGDRILLITTSVTTAPNLVPVSCRTRTTAMVIERAQTGEVVIAGLPQTNATPLAGLALDALVGQVRAAAKAGRNEDW